MVRIPPPTTTSAPRPTATKRFAAIAGAEPPAPLQAELFTFTHASGEERTVRIARHVVPDSDLIDGGKPGDEVDWRINYNGVFNPFFGSLNNRADPALLRQQARFLELSAGATSKATLAVRDEVKSLARQTLAELSPAELAYFPKASALAIVKRLANAAEVPLELIRVQGRAGQAAQSLTAWAAQPAKRWTPTFQELAVRRTPGGRAAWEQHEQRVAVMTTFFEHHPHATLGDYQREMDRRQAHADPAFWGAMQEMFERAELADIAGTVGRGGGGGWYATSPVVRLAPAPPSSISAPLPTQPTKPTPSRPTLPPHVPSGWTVWERLSHPRFAHYNAARAVGAFDGSFEQYLRV